MKRAVWLLVAASLCLITVGWPAEDKPLATRVDHFYVESEKAQSLFTFFKETFQLVESWPFRDAGTHTSGGLWLGNTILEFVTFPNKGDKPVKTELRGIAFEPAGGADETAAELAKRGVSRGEVENRMRLSPDGQMRVAWSLLYLKDFPPTEASLFFVDYKLRESVAARNKARDEEFEARRRGPLGIIGVAEITVGLQDIEEARGKWSALLAPSPQISEDAFVFQTGPRIRLVRAESPGIQGIVLTVRSLDDAEKFLKERQLLVKDVGHIGVSPKVIEGLSIRLVEAAQAQEPAGPLIGHGLGVDHVGIVVRSLDKTLSDYEQALGFKCFRVPRIPDGIVSSCIFFDNSSYLELISVAAQPSGKELSGQAKRYADFVEKREGAMFLGLATSSAKDAAQYLKAQNFEVFLFGEESVTKEGETKPSPPLAYFIAISPEPSKNRRAFTLPIFPLEYVSQNLDDIREDGMMIHPNSALRLHSVWFAVRDLKGQLQTIEQAGLEPGEPRVANFLGASGREVKAGQGSLLLLKSTDENGELNKSLSNRDDGSIVGVSIEVSDVEKARSLIEGRSERKLEPYDGFYGRSILIPPEMTHGVWLELFQR